MALFTFSFVVPISSFVFTFFSPSSNHLARKLMFEKKLVSLQQFECIDNNRITVYYYNNSFSPIVHVNGNSNAIANRRRLKSEISWLLVLKKDAVDGPEHLF